MKNIMIDIETAGIAPKGAILTIAALEFDPFGADISSTNRAHMFYKRVNLASSVAWGGEIDPNTTTWWMEQEDGPRHEAFSEEPRLDLDEALTDLEAWFGIDTKKTFVWARPPSFDLAILDEAYESVGMPVPWSFRNFRDVRTIIHTAQELVGISPPITNIDHRHHAGADAVAQAKQVQWCFMQMRGERANAS